MCLIITGTAAKVRETLLHTPGLLADIFKTNPDGIGIMYASRRGLRIFKSLPKSVSAAAHFLSRMPGDERNLAIHFRWTTHGHTNKDNCHPYVVVPGKAAMMHNGVLRTGNSADRSRSDTWHFIEDYLKDAVAMAPQLVHNGGYKAFIKEFIGSSNRLVFMTDDGTMSVVNAGQGIEHEGLWFSNTYAWTPGILIESERRNYTNGGSYQGSSFRGGVHHGYVNGYVDDDYGDVYDSAYGAYSVGGAQSGGTKSPAAAGSGTSLAIVHNAGVTQGSRFSHRDASGRFTKEDEAEEQAWRATVIRSQQGLWPKRVIDQGERAAGDAGGQGNAGEKKQPAIWTASTSGNVVVRPSPMKQTLETALLTADVDTVAGWFTQSPRTTIHMLFNCFQPMPTKWTDRVSLDVEYLEAYDMCLANERLKLIAYVERGPNSVTRAAEVVCYYLDWLDFYEAMRLRVYKRKDARQTPPDPEAGRTVTVVGGVAVASTELADRMGLPRKDDDKDEDDGSGYAG